MKLKYRLYGLVAAAIVPMVVFAGFAAVQLQETMRASALQSIQESSNTTALLIDREIAASLASVKVLASSPTIDELDWQHFHEFATKATATSGGWVVLFDPDGKQIVNTRMPFGAPLPHRAVKVEISDILKQDAPQVSGIIWSPILSRHVVLVELPFRTTSGERYVLSQAFFAEHFNIAVTDRDVPESWVLGVFDKEGITVSRNVDGDRFVGKQVPSATLAAMNMGDVTLKHFIDDETEVYDVITHSKLSGWVVSVGVPVLEIDGKLRRAGSVAFIGLLLAMAIAIGVATFIGTGLVSAIRAAARSSRAIGRGESISKAGPTGIRELDSLQDAIYQAGQELIAARDGRHEAENRNAQLLKSEQEARHRADTENKRKDEFLAMLGHELRNPLSAITSAGSMLKLKASAPEAVLKAATVIQRQSGHLRKILDDMLDLSRVMYGKVVLDSAVFDLADLVENCLDVLQQTGKLDGHVFSFDKESVEVYGDATRIEQVFTNVMVNATKYTPVGGNISVRVTADGADALIVVADNGVGIEPATIPHIFDVFVQGDQSIARTKGGMGLGLSLARKLVELHQGSITAESDGVGKGSRFFIRLPRSAVSRDVQIVSSVSVRSDIGYQILVVEDQDDGREMMEMLLTSMGHRVTTARNGEEALDAVQAGPDLVLSDIGLPEMDGYQLASRLRSNPETAGIKLVALTGYGLEDDKKKTREAGFDFHLTKPLRESEFQSCLDQLFAGRKHD
jgi:signal transduction histidine kinase